MQQTKHPTVTTRSSAGFSLVEILLSLGIFAIGMTAIVSLFPAAAILQRETAQEVISDMAAESAASIIDSQSLTYNPPGSTPRGDLEDYHPSAASTNAEAVPLADMGLNATLITDRYTVGDRSYPTAMVNGTDVSGCDLHWVPFVQDIAGDPNSPNWVVRLFILESDSRATYADATGDANESDPDTVPKVRPIGVTGVSGNTFTLAGTGDLEPGDIVMDSNGINYTVTEVDSTTNEVTVSFSIPVTPSQPSAVWYAPRQGGTNSPTQRVVTIEVDVVAP